MSPWIEPSHFNQGGQTVSIFYFRPHILTSCFFKDIWMYQELLAARSDPRSAQPRRVYSLTHQRSRLWVMPMPGLGQALLWWWWRWGCLSDQRSVLGDVLTVWWLTHRPGGQLRDSIHNWSSRQITRRGCFFIWGWTVLSAMGWDDCGFTDQQSSGASVGWDTHNSKTVNR